jgi:hypothetical protein
MEDCEASPLEQQQLQVGSKAVVAGRGSGRLAWEQLCRCVDRKENRYAHLIKRLKDVH